MCIGVPGMIVEIVETKGVVQSRGIQQRVNLTLVPEAKIGDFVLIHAGVAIELINQQEANATLELLEELLLN